METLDESYGGESIVPEDSFLRRLPLIIQSEQRLRLDALVFSADMLEQSWLSLRQIASSAGGEAEKITRRHRSLALASAWNIIDHLNSVRQLINALLTNEEECGPLTSNLLRLLDVPRILRNKMDHLNSNIRNLAAMKGRKPAVFGTLGYFVCDPTCNTRGYSILLQTGLVHGSEGWKAVNPAGRRITPPADLFELSAFGHTIELGPPLAALKAWLDSQTEDFERQIREQVSSISKEQGYSEEDLLRHSGSGFALVLAMEFGKRTGTPRTVE